MVSQKARRTMASSDIWELVNRVTITWGHGHVSLIWTAAGSCHLCDTLWWHFLVACQYVTLAAARVWAFAYKHCFYWSNCFPFWCREKQAFKTFLLMKMNSITHNKHAKRLLISHSTKTTGVTNNFNNGSVLWSVSVSRESEPACWPVDKWDLLLSDKLYVLYINQVWQQA